MNWLEDIKRAVVFLTLLPVKLPEQETGRPLAKAMRAFPAIGAAIGLFGGLIFCIAKSLMLSDAVAALFAIGAITKITGALHEDGLADMADSLHGDSSERRLEIMKDSHIGTFGILALIGAIIFKVLAISDIAGQLSNFGVLVVLVAAGAISRFFPVALMHLLEPAREDGLAAESGQPDQTALLESLALTGIILLLSWMFGFSLTAIIAGIVAALLAAIGPYCYARYWLNGQTGDIAGATQQMTEMGFLLGALIIFSN